MANFEEIVRNELARQKAIYEEACREAREAQQNANIKAMTSGTKMTEEEIQESLQMACIGIPQPDSEEVLRRKFSFLQEPEEPIMDNMMNFSAPNLSEAIYKVGKKYWSVPERKFVSAPTDKTKVIELGGPQTDENLKESLILYKLPLGPELLTKEELLENLRTERDKRLEEHDSEVAKLNRQLRKNPGDATLTAKLAVWDAYAVELCDLPGKTGSPWDGGESKTPWPKKPA